MRSQAEKCEAFDAMHRRERAFVIPNPYDAGTARLLAHMGFEALATTSSGCAYTMGRTDGSLAREQVLEHVRSIVESADVPVSADLESGFGDDLNAVAETYRLAAATGLAGGSIEDSWPARRGPGQFSLAEATARVRAAAEAVHALPFRFVLTARAENYLVGNPGLRDTIARLQAYQEAGADVLYAPGLVTKDDIATVVREVDRPVNVLAVMPGMKLSVAELSEIGVKRISVGGALSRAALGAVMRAGREMIGNGTFEWVKQAAPGSEVAKIFSGERSPRE